MPYRPARDGLVVGKVAVSGAPSGFSPMFSGVGACRVGSTPIRACAHPRYTFAGQDGSYHLQLPPGIWIVAGWYELAPFGGQFLSHRKVITVASSTTVHKAFAVAYRPAGTVAGTVTVTDAPTGTTIEGVGALACPPDITPTITQVAVQCVSGGGSSGSYTISTLPPGKCVLYPYYFTSSGPAIGSKGTATSVSSGGTSNVDLSIEYQPSS